MRKVDIPTTLKYTKELTLLYVEDDLNLQTQTKELFESLFKDVTVADNGKKALEFYLDSEYDVVITDVKMPKLDGIELTREIKSINPDQEIIITSAYNDSENLLTFINLHVSYFILKPINTNDLIATIYGVSKKVVNTKQLELYRKDIEHKNAILEERNTELQSLERVLELKLLQLSNSLKKEERVIQKTVFELSSEHLKELEELEIDIKGVVAIIALHKNINENNIKILAELMLGYSRIFSHYEQLHRLQKSFLLFIDLLSEAADSNIEKISTVPILLESLIYTLQIWREKIVKDKIKKASKLEIIMINDIHTIIANIDDKKKHK